MAGDSYNDYTSLQRDSRSIPGYLPPESSGVAPHHLWNSDNPQATSLEYLRNDQLQPRTGAYASGDMTGVGSLAAPGYVGLSAGAVARGYTPFEDPPLLRNDIALGIKPAVADIERFVPRSKAEEILVDESNILFVDGLPSDCTRREVAHLFRPFIGFKEIRVIHKEPRRVGDKNRVLCFVEFDDAKCALTALQALQGYKFDDKKPDAPVLRIQFAKFPFSLPS
ncbi:U2 small nuclear ribonucleoprotein B'' [Apostasia shenzhenica]|uniref:U2 small nuclear ribonucleoprotein B n=1 Tax=Apostasia shenzhenica TaxID=1088818 RepID=A0A2I0B031_9ASPA|nr:U2 small nuclear ribonucleoprotein B'' [Apostasia shenzhenica]